ncbi:PTS glucitol/sorbitol transporter subunit IIA [Acidipropionibacterium jensenii]|uniref:PTS glucitol/sorbitol transporter subunit IIA n=1 Tax=Acidipropionibacterium jensenii TaxID=1749 RepID=UPI00214C5BBC|nr:PTS glucitol/sorbitol transporter subunit IIA [Acidipropionibacterium jensenii]
MPVIYSNTIRSVGSEASSFLTQKMLVTFGDQAPEGLRDFCYALPAATCTGTIKVGDTVLIDGRAFPITALGEVAQRNLDSLGHVTLVFDGAPDPRLDGALHVATTGDLPSPQQGSTIVIESA